MALIRINKFLSDSGTCSRRAADDAIQAGRVTVNGVPATLGIKVDTENDCIAFDGNPVRSSRTDFIYYALYKPHGVVSTAFDPQGRRKVTDLVPPTPRVYPVGRLDYDSEGLIILTNDGEFTQKLSHPSYKHEKEYHVQVKSQKLKVENLDEYIRSSFTKGLEIDGKIMKADKVSDFHRTNNFELLTFNLVIHTGYNRQIRKMCAKLRLEVTRLIRTRTGKLNLNQLNLRPGEYKIISKEQIL